MKRRDFLALAGAAAAFPRVALAQQSPKVPRLAFVHPTVPADQMTEASSIRDVAVFLKQLASNGFADGSTVTVERWSGGGDPARYADVARAAAASSPDVIYVTESAMSAAVAAATKTIPIVAVSGDLLADGIVPMTSHPGGNVTGVNTTVDVLGEAGKRLGALHAAFPMARRVTCLANASSWDDLGMRLTDTARRAGLEVVSVIPKTPMTADGYRDVFAEIAAQRAEMLLLLNGPENTTFGVQIGALALAARLPGISFSAPFLDGGGLMGYGANFDALYRGAAGQVGRVLSGAKAGDMPVILPQRFDFTVNLKAAKDMGINLPQAIVDAATELRQ